MKKHPRKNVGQGLVEYLILTCLVAVSAIAVVSVVGQNIRARYANISAAIRGTRGGEKLEAADDSSVEMRGFHDFGEASFNQGN